MTTPLAPPRESFGSRIAARLPRVLVPYIGGAWGVVQFLDWATGRYLWSPYLVDFAVWLAFLLLPTAIVLAWFRGGERQRWTRTEKVGIPLNLACAAGVLLVAFHGRELGAVTRRIAITNADGQTVERVVPKSAFRKHAALFFLANDSGDKQLDWLGRAVPVLAQLDLSQDLFVDAKTQYDFVDALKKAQQSPGDAPPLALDQQLARQAHVDFIVFGRLNRDHDDYVIDLSLAPTERGTPIAERRHRGPDLFRLVDALTTQLRKDLGIPSSHLESSPDLPVAEISTHSLPALRAHVLALDAWGFEHDAHAALAAFDQAVKLDPTYALAWLNEGEVLFQDNQQRRMELAWAAVKRNEYRLPERDRFEFDSSWAIFHQDPVKELAVLRQWVTLYPDDAQAHEKLFLSYMRRQQIEEAKAELKHLIDLDPQNPVYLLKLGSASERQGNWDAAIGHYLAYQQRAPSDAEGYLRAANAYRATARLDDAKASYEKALAVDPERIDALLGVASVEMRRGKLDLAQAAVERALKQATRDEDRNSALRTDAALLALQGRFKEAVERERQSWALWKTTESSAEALRNQLEDVDDLVTAGRRDEALAMIANARKIADSVNVMFSIDVAAATLDVESNDVAHAGASIAELEKLMRTYDVEQLLPFIAALRGRVDEARSAWEAAAQHYREALRNNPSPDLMVRLARCQRHGKQLKEAHATLAAALQQYPSFPKAHDELARLLLDEGDRKRAAEELGGALAMWAHADEGYEPAVEARALRATLGRE